MFCRELKKYELAYLKETQKCNDDLLDLTSIQTSILKLQDDIHQANEQQVGFIGRHPFIHSFFKNFSHFPPLCNSYFSWWLFGNLTVIEFVNQMVFFFVLPVLKHCAVELKPTLLFVGFLKFLGLYSFDWHVLVDLKNSEFRTMFSKIEMVVLAQLNAWIARHKEPENQSLNIILLVRHKII